MTATAQNIDKHIPARATNPRARDEYLMRLYSLRLGLGTDRLERTLRVDSRYVVDVWREATDTPQLAEDVKTGTPVQASLAARLQALQSGECPTAGVLQSNLAELAALLQLTTLEVQLLECLILAETLPDFGSVLRTFGDDVTLAQVIGWLAVALDHPEAEVRAACNATGVLRRSGLIRAVANCSEDFAGRLAVLRGFSYRMALEQTSVLELFTEYFAVGPAAELTCEDFSHLAAERELLRSYLTTALKSRTRGVNILLYGRPGTGKTQLARWLAAELGSQSIEIAATDNECGSKRDNDRLAALGLAQTVLGTTDRNLILFDEADTALNCDLLAQITENSVGGPPRTKAWVTQLIEHNPIPVIWIANHIGWLEEAVVRRFDLVIRMPEPTRAMRLQVLQHAIASLGVRDSWLEQQAGDYQLMPGHISRAARVLHAVPAVSGAAAEATFEQVVEATLTASGVLRRATYPASAAGYSLDCLSPDCDLQALVDGLACAGQGRLCLYGPPGTGKTAFAHHLGRCLDRPVMVRAASDLLGMFLGDTEKNLAAAFRDARREGAILLLDEVDSFLKDRTSAKHSWECTQVNELLGQMEAFDGIFIAATNLMHELDAAAIRRFDIRVAFGYLQPAALSALFARAMAGFGLDPAGAEPLAGELGRITTATPGDFAAIRRRRQIFGAPTTAHELLADLQTEQACKREVPTRGIGFLA